VWYGLGSEFIAARGTPAAAENGAPGNAGNPLALCLVLTCLLNLDCVPQRSGAAHAPIHGACLCEVRAAQANVADFSVGFQMQHAKSDLRALGTRFQIAVFLKRSRGIDYHFIGLEFEHSNYPHLYPALSGQIEQSVTAGNKKTL
jgi:hypothetical protein